MSPPSNGAPVGEGGSTFWQTVRAVAWSFIGIRRGSEHERDMARLNPVHVVVAGVLGALLFVAALVLLVQWVVRSSGAG